MRGLRPEQILAESFRIIDAEVDAHPFGPLEWPVVRRMIHAAGDLERMGDLALHVARASRRRHPASVLPDEIKPYFAEMGKVACELAHKAAEVIRHPDLERARELDSDDDAMDDLHRHMFTVLMGREWNYGVAAAVDITLLARFYERYGDHAVAVARRMVYVITGQMPTASDA